MMKDPQNYIYGGLFILILGMGGDFGKIIPFEIKIISGFFFILYGVYLFLEKEKGFRLTTFDFSFKLSELSSKVYFLIGVLLINS